MNNKIKVTRLEKRIFFGIVQRDPQIKETWILPYQEGFTKKQIEVESGKETFMKYSLRYVVGLF